MRPASRGGAEIRVRALDRSGIKSADSVILGHGEKHRPRAGSAPRARFALHVGRDEPRRFGPSSRPNPAVYGPAVAGTQPSLPTRSGVGGGFGGFGGGRGGQAPVVASGDYLVTLTVGGKSYKQLLRVERVSGGDDTSAFGFDDDHDK